LHETHQSINTQGPVKALSELWETSLLGARLFAGFCGRHGTPLEPGLQKTCL
jgi:hypothetical protein